jgi:hypothetical protein
MLAREVPGAERARHVVVIGDGDDVEPSGGGAHDRLGRLPSVAVERMHVQIRATREARSSARPVSPQREIHHVTACTAGIDRMPFPS